MAIYIVDSSNHRTAGEWVSDCIPERSDKTVVDRDGCGKLLPVKDAECVILTGSEHSVFEEENWIDDQLELVGKCAEAKIPMLGICFGHQLVIRFFYGKDALQRRRKPEVGWWPITLQSHPLFTGLPEVITPYLFHFDEAVMSKIPDFENLASSELCPCHTIVHGELPIVGVQFHPEINEEDGRAGYERERAIIEAFGVELAEVLGSSEGRNGLYYPEVVSNFVEYYL
jgi:GMP synthase-like glutamine amidotransferase